MCVSFKIRTEEVATIDDRVEEGDVESFRFQCALKINLMGMTIMPFRSGWEQISTGVEQCTHFYLSCFMPVVNSSLNRMFLGLYKKIVLVKVHTFECYPYTVYFI